MTLGDVIRLAIVDFLVRQPSLDNLDESTHN
jgi:hypothetical protein